MPLSFGHEVLTTGALMIFRVLLQPNKQKLQRHFDLEQRGVGRECAPLTIMAGPAYWLQNNMQDTQDPYDAMFKEVICHQSDRCLNCKGAGNSVCSANNCSGQIYSTVSPQGALRVQVQRATRSAPKHVVATQHEVHLTGHRDCCG